MRFIRDWRPRHLLAAWSAYWLSLAAVTLGPAARAIWRATRPEGNGSVTASMGDAGLTVMVTAQQGATTLWSGSVSLMSLAIWIAGPPLLIYLTWVLLHRRRALRDAPTARAALREAAPPTIVPRHADKSAVDKTRDR